MAYTKSTHELYKESIDSKEKGADKARSFSIEGNDTSGYVSTDPIYQNYANETEKPIAASSGPDVAIVKEFKDFETALSGEKKEKKKVYQSEKSEKTEKSNMHRKATIQN